MLKKSEEVSRIEAVRSEEAQKRQSVDTLLAGKDEELRISRAECERLRTVLNAAVNELKSLMPAKTAE
ncbi:MAG: hypothetical protein V8R49_01675 [Duodenibacillus massiliensis]